MATQQKLYWNPMGHLNAAYTLRHQAPALVGRLPRLRMNSLHAAAALARKAASGVKPPKLHPPKASTKPALPFVNSPTPAAAPPIASGISGAPPAGSSPPAAPKPPTAVKGPTTVSGAKLPRLPAEPAL